MPLTTKTGNKVIVGGDMRIDDVKRRIRDAIASQVMVLAVIVFIGFAVTLFFAWMMAKRGYGNLFSMPISRKRQVSIRRRYILFSSLLFLIILSIGSMAFVTLIRPIARENVKTKLMLSVEKGRFELEAELSRKIALAQRIADSLLVRRHLRDPADHRLRTMAFQELLNYSNLFATDGVFWISDRDKKYHFDGKYLYTLDPAEKGSEWYDKALKMTSPFQLKVNFDVGLKKNMLWINVPVFDDRRVPVGLVGIGLQLDDFIKSIYQSQQKTDELYFFNLDGEITGAHDIGLLENKVNLADFLGQTGMKILTVAKGLSRTSGTSYFETDKRTAVVIGSIPMIDWNIFAVHHFILGELLPTGMIALFIVVIMAIFICFVILNLYVFRMLQPLNSLIKEVNQTFLTWGNKDMEDIHEIEILNKFMKQSITDPVTSVYNRRYLDVQLKKLINSLSRSCSELSILLIDIDYFKKYNDTYGHDAGDSCLRTVAIALSQCVKREGDFIARYGGEEFAVVLPHTDAAGTQIMADEMLGKIRECNIPHKASDIAGHVTISIGGITSVVNPSLSAKKYIKWADEALYESKKCGRNRYTLKSFKDTDHA